jgi:translocation and assembly module TamB
LGWRELKANLPRLVSGELSRALGRPIKLGELQRFGFTGLRFGETIIPPTAEDFTWARVQTTDIALNPWDLILRRTFRPSLLFIRPEIAVKQRFDRQWVLKTPGSLDTQGKIRTEIGRIRIRNAEVSIGPVSTRQEGVEPPPGISSTQLFILQNVTVNVEFSGEENEQINLSLGGRLKNGTFQTRGATNLKTRESNFTVQGKKLRIDVLNPFLGGNLYLGEGYVYSNLYTEYRPQQDPPISVEGAVRLEDGQAVLTGLPSELTALYGRLQFRGQRVAFDDATFNFGPIAGEVRGSVSWQDGYQVGVLLPDVSVEQVETAFKQPLPLTAAGRLALDARVLGPLKTPRIQGNLQNLEPISVDRLTLDTVTADFSGDAETVFLDNFQVFPTTGGSVTAKGQVNFAENILVKRGLPPTALNLTANVDLPLDPLATLYDANLPVKLGRLTAIAEASGPLTQPIATANWQLQEGIAVGSGRVNYADRLATLTDIQLIVADSGTITATGQADLATQQLDLIADARLPLDEIAQQAAISLPAGITLGTVTANVNAGGPFRNPTAEALWQLAGGSVPGEGRLTYADQVVALRDTTLTVGGGTLGAAGQADLRSGLWDIGLSGNNLGLSEFSPQLIGPADLSLMASGSLLDLSPASIRAAGDLTFEAGVPLALAGAETLLDGPLAVNFNWDGSILGVPSLTAPGLSVSGQIATVLNPTTGFPAPDTLNFAVSLIDYDLAKISNLSVVSSTLARFDVPVRGRLDFTGMLSGLVRSPSVQADIGLRDAALGPLTLISDVSGTVNGTLLGALSLNLVGDLTELRADIGSDRLPNYLLFRNGPLLTEARREGDWLRGKVREFPLQALGIRPVKTPDLGVISGSLRSDFEVQLSTLFSNPTARASFAVNRPGLGAISASDLQGQLWVSNRQAHLDNTFLALQNSRFDITGQASLRSPLAAEARIITTNADIQDIFTTLSIYDLDDFKTFLTASDALGNAADLATTPIETDPTDLLAQIQQAAIAREQQLAQQQTAERQLVPPLADLQGNFSTDVSLAVSPDTGVEMTFDVNGQDWIWGQYDFENRFVARGLLANQILTLDPIRLESGASRFNLEGQLALDGFDTQLEVSNFDLAPVARWLDLPRFIEGQFNALATLTGTPDNPTLLGTAVIEDATVNGYPLTFDSRFSYQDAWLRFNAQVKGEPDEPLMVQGQVPYALPFMTQQPNSDQLLVRASLGSGGFALIDMFRPYVAWGDGDANLLVEATGTLAAPQVNGAITFQDASITSEYLRESLTDLNGTVGFVGDRIQVPGLQGTLLDGSFELMGDLPFLKTTALTDPPTQPLILSLNTLKFDFADEISSQIDGEVRVTDALQDPTIGGAINLSEININVGNDLIGLANTLFADPGVESAVEDFSTTFPRFSQIPGKFDNFTVRLTDTARIRANPLLSLEAIGEVTLSGPLLRPSGDGYVELLDGWVNTITTNFFLVTAERRNIVTFSSKDGLNPYFDLAFEGYLPLQRQYALKPNEFNIGNTSEVPDLDPLGSVTLFDEILIEAQVRGYFSDGMSILSLESNPYYSRERLLSMVSGGYLSDLPDAEPALATGANVLFSFLTEQQNEIGSFLGLRRFRIGATTQLPNADEEDTFGVGLGVNVGITDSLSAGLVQVINQSQPYQLNVNYRLNREMGIGASTDFTDETRIFWQYRISF